MDTDPPLTTVYVWVDDGVTVTECHLAANTPSPADATVYPSDHMAVVATIALHSGAR